MFNFKVLAATALIAVSTFGAMTPANAAASKCWIRHRGNTARPFHCNVNRRTNANGHTVFDVTHYQNKGASFTVVFWTNRTAEVIFAGKAPVSVPFYIDRDGDQRIVVGNEEFIVRI